MLTLFVMGKQEKLVSQYTLECAYGESQLFLLLASPPTGRTEEGKI